MDTFNQLVGEQLKTMEKLLFLQAEIERCQQMESGLIERNETEKVEKVKEEVKKLKKELKEVQEEFTRQTNEVIHTYSQTKVTN
ncbi:YgaB family protein [Bacillus spongiae]|uniref:YgaB family protein n=1 Tax=Bacillus spongiae TaxID=2683610 RepID=A0ABU8HGN4_9BACI